MLGSTRSYWLHPHDAGLSHTQRRTPEIALCSAASLGAEIDAH